MPLLVDVDDIFEENGDNYEAWVANVRSIDYPRVLCPEQTRRIHYIDTDGYLCELMIDTREITKFKVKPVPGSIIEVSQRDTRIKCIYSVKIIYDSKGNKIYDKNNNDDSDDDNNETSEDEYSHPTKKEKENKEKCENSDNGETDKESQSEYDTSDISLGSEYEAKYLDLIEPNTKQYSYNLVALTYDNREIILGSTTGLLQNFAFIPSQTEPSDIEKAVILCRGCYITDQTIHLVDSNDEMYKYMVDVSLWFKGHRSAKQIPDIPNNKKLSEDEVKLGSLSSYTMTGDYESNEYSNPDNSDVCNNRRSILTSTSEYILPQKSCDTEDIDLFPCQISKFHIYMMVKDGALFLFRISKK